MAVSVIGALVMTVSLFKKKLSSSDCPKPHCVVLEKVDSEVRHKMNSDQSRFPDTVTGRPLLCHPTYESVFTLFILFVDGNFI